MKRSSGCWWHGFVCVSGNRIMQKLPGQFTLNLSEGRRMCQGIMVTFWGRSVQQPEWSQFCPGLFYNLASKTWLPICRPLLFKGFAQCQQGSFNKGCICNMSGGVLFGQPLLRLYRRLCSRASTTSWEFGKWISSQQLRSLTHIFPLN